MNNNLLVFIFVSAFCVVFTATAQSSINENSQELEVGVGGNIILDEASQTYVKEGADLHLHPLWESRYISEGRDNLSGNGIVSVASEFNYNNIAFIPWAASGINSDYSELNLNIIYATQLFDTFEVFAGYNYILSHEASSNAHDNEISLDFLYFYDDKFQLISSVYYSFDAKGAFLELAVKKDYHLNDTLVLDIQTGLGFNADYVSDGHNGFNNVQFKAGLSYQVLDQLELYTYTSYSLAVNKDESRYAGDETLRNFFWGGVGFSYQYRKN